MRRAVLFASAAMMLAGCQQYASEGLGNTNHSAAEEAGRAADAASTVEMVAPPDLPADARVPVPGEEADAPADAAPQLAYSYRYTLALPNRALRGLAARHESACAEAGVQQCQVIGSSTQAYGEDQQTVTLEIRAAPGWMAAFREGLAGEADGAGGEIVESATESEDLTRALIDTEAHLRAKTTLRDRLQAMLATRDGNLQTVLEVERELARVQGEIDSATSTLQAMRARVSMSRLTVTYQSQGVYAPDSATRPLSEALQNALGLFMMGLAAIVSVLAFGLPFLIVLGPIVWLLLRWRARRKARRAAAQTTSDA